MNASQIEENERGGLIGVFRELWKVITFRPSKVADDDGIEENETELVEEWSRLIRSKLGTKKEVRVEVKFNAQAESPFGSSFSGYVASLRVDPSDGALCMSSTFIDQKGRPTDFHLGSVFAANQTVENILIEFDDLNCTEWTDATEGRVKLIPSSDPEQYQRGIEAAKFFYSAMRRSCRNVEPGEPGARITIF